MPFPGETLFPSETLYPGDGYPLQTIVGADLAAELPWLLGDETLLWYEDAIGALFEQTAQIVFDQGVSGTPAFQTGYGSIFTVWPRFAGDTAICPTDQLGYLGQFVGVSLPPDVDDATARSLITGEAGTHRGTPSAIEMAAKRYLSGTQSVINVERTRPDGSRSGYWFVLIVKPEEVIDAVALTAAVNAVKPGGVLWALVESDGAPWVSDSGTWASDSSSWSS